MTRVGLAHDIGGERTNGVDGQLILGGKVGHGFVGRRREEGEKSPAETGERLYMIAMAK